MNYLSELNQRYWEYQKRYFGEWDRYFERPNNHDQRPPVFIKKEAWRNILFDPNASQQETRKLCDLLPERERHRWFGSMNSSHALTQSIFGNLIVHGKIEELIGLQDDDGFNLFGKAIVSSDRFSMEHKIDYLGEPKRTSIDVYLNGEYRIAIECKLRESEVGECSRPDLTKKDSNYEKDHCNGTYTKQRNRKERCSLSEIGVKYWHYIPQIIEWKNDCDNDPCPLNKTYQLVRNILAVCVTPDGKVSHNLGHAIMIYDERNPAFQEGGKGYNAFKYIKESLKEQSILRKCSWQRIVEHLREKKLLPWLTERLKEKYGF